MSAAVALSSHALLRPRGTPAWPTGSCAPPTKPSSLFFARAFASAESIPPPSTHTTARKQSVSFYEDLGVSTSASREDIRKAFLQLAKRYHPDISGSANVEAFQRIQLAYNVLSDEARRREYDWRSRGIWRHSSIGPRQTGPLDNKAEKDSSYRSYPVQYTEEELARMEAADLARNIEYQQLCTRRLREIAKQRETERLKAYKDAWNSYQSKTETIPLEKKTDARVAAASFWWQHIFKGWWESSGRGKKGPS